MGVRGLTTFIQRYHDKHKEKIYLHDCPVVVDGCNLMFFLYFDWRQNNPAPATGRLSGSPLSKAGPWKQPHLFGGDYIAYAQNVREFFQHLKLCGITSIVLFDGAYDDLKIKTAFKRFADNLKENVRGGVNCLKGVVPGSSYCPVFVKAVFVEILQEQKIIHYQTEHEADPTIAFIARRLGNCPILSSDSDFHIYINSVVLPLHTLRFKKVLPSKDKRKSVSPSQKHDGDAKEKIWTLHSEFVSLPRLCKKEFRLEDPRLLPLAAVILGNDWISTATFYNFHSKKPGVKKTIRIAFLLKWLGKQRSYRSVVRAMLNSVREAKREVTLKLITEIVAAYEGHGGEESVWKLLIQTGLFERFQPLENGESELLDNMMDMLSLDEDSSKNPVDIICEEDCDEIMGNLFDVEEENDSDSDSSDAEPDEEGTDNDSNKSDLQLPEWYIDNHLKGTFPTHLLKLKRNRMAFLSAQVDVACLPSTHTLSVPVIQVIGGLLLGHEKTLTLVTRNKSGMEKIPVKTQASLSVFGKLPVVSECSPEFKTNLPLTSRIQILLETLGLFDDKVVDFINEWPPSVRIWITCLLYFMKTENKPLDADIDDTPESLVKKTSTPTMIALLLCVIKTPLLNPSGSNRNSSSNESDRVKISQLLDQSDPTLVSKLKSFYASFERTEDTGKRHFMKSYDISRPYNVSKYTCLLFHVHHLNRLLGDPFKPPRIGSMLNNWFIFNLSGKLLSECSTPTEDEPCSSYAELALCISSLMGFDDIGVVIKRTLELIQELQM